MTAFVRSGVKVERDTEGFLVHSDQWSEELADVLARESGIGELTPRHWVVIRSMRTAFLDHGSLPWVQMLSKVSEIPCEQLYELFPHSPSRLVTKIAGIPKNRACI
jgi:TusE/DsrC/DsvC family sulfur relay protein